jgi:hypothetical protein
MTIKHEIKLLEAGSNFAVAQYSGRNYPGIVIQGDTLRILLDEIEELGDEVSSGDYEAVRNIVGGLHEQLVDILKYYEDVLERNGMELPYINSVRKR